jgi:LDH2 family malate/lactate/ureidoglycolate dehydrogenase
MNNRPIAQASDADLRLSAVAIKRAALRARELAQRTGTALVISRNGVLHHLDPASLEPEPAQPDAAHTLTP